MDYVLYIEWDKSSFMTDSIDNLNYVEKIGNYDKVEILVNEKQEIEFDGIIDPVYINIHFHRILKSSRYFDIVRMVGHHGKKNKETITEVIVGK